MAFFKKFYSVRLPWFTDDRNFVFLLLILTFIALVPQIIIYKTLPVILLNDSVWYFDFTRYFAAGGFVPDYYASVKSAHAMIIYPIGYSLFLDFCRFWAPPSGWGRSIVICQHLLSLGSVVLVFLIGKRTGRSIEGFCAAILYAFYLPRLIYAQAVMAETLVIFLLLLSLYIFFGIFIKGNKRTGLLLGLVTAMSILTKPLALLCAVIFFIYLLISKAGKQNILGFIFSLVLVIFSNFFYNWHNYHEFVLTTITGGHLADRVIGFDQSFDKTNPETIKIMSQCEKSGLNFRFPGAWWNYYRALRSNGLSPQDSDRLMMRAALAGIRLNPFNYIVDTWDVFKMNIIDEDNWIEVKSMLTKPDYLQYLRRWSTYPGGDLPPAEFESRRKVLRNIAVDYPEGFGHVLGTGWINFFDNNILICRRAIGWVFIFVLLYGLFSKDKVLTFISVFVFFNLLLIALTEGPYPRFIESFVPVAMLSVILALVTIWKRKLQ